MWITETVLMLGTGKKCRICSGQMEDSRKISALFGQLTEAEAGSLYTAEEVPDAHGVRRLVQQFGDQPDSAMILAWVGKHPAGCAILQPRSTYARGRHWAEIRLGVARAYQGMGIGKALMGQIFRTAAKLQYEFLECVIPAASEAAAAFGQKLGFTCTFERPQALKLQDGSYGGICLLEKSLMTGML